MLFSVTLSVLLASFISSPHSLVSAAPVDRNDGLVTLPLKRLESRADVHPQVLYQQHINRGHKRLARMSGSEEPSAAELESSLVKRILSIRDDSDFAKRYNRAGVEPPSKRFNRHGIRELYSFKDLEEAAVPKDSPSSKKNATAASQADGAAPPIGNPSGIPDPNTPNLTPANPPTAPNSLGLDIEANDVGYLATVLIGTPPREFNILMDSGSADFWVGAEGCQSVLGGCGNHQFLGPATSSSFKGSNTPFQIQYGTGAVAGNVVQDNINLAGLKLTAHTFGTASEETEEFAGPGVSFDGLMGLALSVQSEQKTLTPVEALAKNGLIRDAITSYKISRLEDGKNDGEITFGGLDATKFDSKTLTTVKNVSPVGFWEASMPDISVDGKSAGLKARTAILDTGTTLIIAPPADVAAVHALIPGAKPDGQGEGGFTVPCNTKAQVALTFGNRKFTIDPRDLAFLPISNNPAGDCLSGISPGQIGGPNQWLVGDVFLKSAYFSTDVTKNQISLANLV